MTDKEFKTWDRHKAENLSAQRDDALARLAAAEKESADLRESADSRVAAAGADARKAREECSGRLQAVADAADRFAAEVTAAAEKRVADALAPLRGELEAARQTARRLETDLETARGELAAARELVAALGGTELGRKMDRERRLAEAHARRSAAEDEIGRIGAEGD